MIVLLGLALLLSLAAIGRDARVLPFHGTCAAACVSGIGHGAPALMALALLPVLNGAGMIVLRRHVAWRAGDLRSRRQAQQEAGMAVCAAIALVLLTALAAAPGLPVLICIGIVLAGLCGAALSLPLLQLTGLLCALNGLLLLGGHEHNWFLVLGTALVWIGLLSLGGWLMPRLAWLRTEGDGDHG
ncbi:hypothetical protein [Asaia krungthepensis]|uniref:DUF4126 domain-containing protein n=1 Tax=Asaia krungthepensis NRIC 0535 TaxID=1307925 RepID=A0ABQ0Q2A7_9PROT|nr:hypothetical protein [Asaia krungthepensis]GBQ87947.1 hypothetical protein AA0535_1410 [Asaia krungthepensis NRIC 0535]